MKKTYEFENLGCAHCAGKMEEKIGKLPDVESVNLSFPMKKMYVETSREDLPVSYTHLTLPTICSV